MAFEKILLIFLICMYEVKSRVEKSEFVNSCLLANCKNDKKVCGIKFEGEGFRLRVFQDECAFLDNKCAVNDNFGYEITNMNICKQVFHLEPDMEPSVHESCQKYKCLYASDDIPVCGLRDDGRGFRIRIFKNKCNLWEYNCENKVNFTMTDFYICKGLELPADTRNFTGSAYENVNTKNVIDDPDTQNVLIKSDEEIDRDVEALNTSNSNERFDDDFYIGFHDNDLESNSTSNTNGDSNDYDLANEPIINETDTPTSNEDMDTTIEPNSKQEQVNDVDKMVQTNNGSDEFKNLIVVRGLVNNWSSVNETIDRFFATTHMFDVPIKEMPQDYLNETTRRRLIKIAGPVKVFIPANVFPKNASRDYEYKPTLNSCYHKCPRSCPATYAPVCGLPGTKAREPTLMFINHCYMDVAQCKQFRENKSPTSHSSAYVEASFIFCLGDTMGRMFNFLPLLKTLQHMGRLPRRNTFHYRFTNLKFFNNFLNVKNPNLMG